MQIEVTPTELEGVLVIDTRFFSDSRGFFIETYTRRVYAEHGIGEEFVQDNHSRSGRGVLRGLHYQDTTAPMGKLVRCSRGSIFDVAVDIRAGSPTFGRWTAAELSEENKRQLWVPAGFAHGFQSLTEVADVQYKCTGYYTPAAEEAIRWDDPTIGVPWPIADPQLSDKDARAQSLKEYSERPAFRY